MSDIKVGDTVKRIRGFHMGMQTGATAKVMHLVSGGLILEGFKGEHDYENFEVVTQTKTVADAYREMVTGFEGKCLWYSPNKRQWTSSPALMPYDSYRVCTREQFEAYAKEQEAKQEGEKWTHVYLEEKAYIKVSEPDCDGYILVVTEGDGYNLVRIDDLKPIKPRITKAEAWDYAVDSGLYAEEIERKYDII